MVPHRQLFFLLKFLSNDPSLLPISKKSLGLKIFIIFSDNFLKEEFIVFDIEDLYG